MSKKISVLFVILALVGIGYYIFAGSDPNSDVTGIVKAEMMKFYYRNGCTWCQKVKSEGTIEKIKQLGVDVEEIDVSIGPVRDKIEGVPAFVINEKVYTGYKSFEELKQLLGYSGNFDSLANLPLSDKNVGVQDKKFNGIQGTGLILVEGIIQLSLADFDSSQAKFYNVKMPSGKIVYFFAVKDQNGIYRAAANACQVCYGERKGFRQEGNEIVCNNCGNRYALEKVATEKGGCNPSPINPDLKVVGGKISITQAELEQIVDLF